VPLYERIALYSVADVALVTATRDGMNLVPYEYIVCRQGMKVQDEPVGGPELCGSGGGHGRPAQPGRPAFNDPDGLKIRIGATERVRKGFAVHVIVRSARRARARTGRGGERGAREDPR